MIPFEYRRMTGPGKPPTVDQVVQAILSGDVDKAVDTARQYAEAQRPTPKPVAKRRGIPKLDSSKRRSAQVDKAVAAYTFDEPTKLINAKQARPVPNIGLRNKPKLVDAVLIRTPTPQVITPNRGLIRPGIPQRMPGHVVIDAVAGSGKTTILEEGVRRIFGKPPKFQGSEQQEAIWEEMCKGPRPGTCVVLSCMNSIVDELSNRLIPPAYATTCHSFGRQIIYKNIGTKKPEVEEDKVRFLLQDHMQLSLHTIYRRMPRFVNSVCQLVKFCKICLIDLDLMEDKYERYDAIQRLIGTYDIEVKDDHMELLIDVAPEMMRLSYERLDTMDYDDMLWLPHRLNIRSRPIDLLLVDERQDLNHAQQEMIYRNGKRIIVVGDTNQAVMGFAGGDFEACEHMNEKLVASHHGCRMFPLTYTRRCCKAVVRLAQTLVPEIEALPDAPEGQVCEMAESVFQQEILTIEDGDMVICRTNAPLVRYAMMLLKNKRRVRIQGRNFGEEIVQLLQGFKALDLPDLIGRLDDWYYKSKAKLEAQKYVSDSKLIALFDQYTSMITFCKESETIAEAIQMIRSLFVDKGEGGVLFSSIHRAKGLEPPKGRAVYFLRYNLLPHPMAQSLRAKKQEYNLQYVGITRAKELLVLIYDDVSQKQDKKRKVNNADSEGH